MTASTARKALYTALMTGSPAGRGHSPDRSEQATALIEAFRDEVLATFTQGDASDILARHREQVLTGAAEHLERIADETEARVAEYYGAASGMGPGSAGLVREAAQTLRGLAARTTQES